MVIVERYLTYTLRHGGSQFSAWHLVTEENVTDGIARFATTKPNVEDGWEILLFPCHDGGTTREVDQNDRFTRLLQGYEQAFCASGISRLVRLLHSPLISDDSPTAATMMSAC